MSVDMPKEGDRYRDTLCGEMVTVKTITQWGRTYYRTDAGEEHAVLHSEFWHGDDGRAYQHPRFVRDA